MTDPIQNRAAAPPFDPPPHPPGPLTPLGAGAKVGEAGLDAFVDKVLSSHPATDAVATAYSSFVRAQTTSVAAYTVDSKTTAIQAKLDGFMHQMTPTYRLPDGSSVAVPAFFRMGAGGRESPQVADNRTARNALASKLGVGSYFDSGRPGALGDIRKMTQGLIDAGKLGPKTGGDALAVRTMAWSFGVGIDCAGYVQHAFYASHTGDASRYGLKSIENENLLSLGSNPKWTNVGLTHAQPGDVMTLGEVRDASQGGKLVEFGHTMIIYDHQLPSPAQRQDLLAKAGAAGEKVLRDPNLHVLSLDSSWGTGDHVQSGAGVQRRTWLYGEATGWLCQTSSGAFVTTGESPFGHTLGGPFRAKVQP